MLMIFEILASYANCFSAILAHNENSLFNIAARHTFSYVPLLKIMQDSNLFPEDLMDDLFCIFFSLLFRI